MSSENDTPCPPILALFGHRELSGHHLETPFKVQTAPHSAAENCL